MKIENLKNNINVRAYVIYVYHRFKASGQMSHAKEYIKRVPEDIQRMENVRGKLHSGAVEFLKDNGFNEREIHNFLENECEIATKIIGKDLVDGELSCGCCKIKVDNWDEHQNSKLHKLIADEVYFIHTLYRRVELQQRIDKMTLGEQGDLLNVEGVA